MKFFIPLLVVMAALEWYPVLAHKSHHIHDHDHEETIEQMAIHNE